MTEKLFWAIKTMLNGGATITETAEFFKLGVSSVGRVKASENMQEYHAIIAAMYAKKKAAKEKLKPLPVEEEKPTTPEPVKADVVTQTPVKPSTQTVIMRPTHELMTEMRKTNELLTLISNKLAYIVDQLV